MSGGARRRLTRRVFLSGAFSAGLFALAGCAAPPTSGPPPKLRALAAAHPLEDIQRLIAEHLKAAGEEAGVSVDLQTESSVALRATLTATEAAGQWPDLALVGAADSVTLAARGQLLDLREALDRVTGLVGDLFLPLRDLAGAGPFLDLNPGQPAPIWAIPYFSIGSTLLVRRDLLDAKGVAAPKTFVEARTVAEQLTDLASDVFGWCANLPLDDATDNLAQVALLAYGAPLFDSLGERAILDPALAADGLRAWVGLYRSAAGASLAPAGAIDWSAADLARAFAEGKLAQAIDAGGLYARIVADRPKLREVIRALPLPGGPAGQYAAAIPMLFVVPSATPFPSLTRALIERILRPERYDALARAGQGAAIPPYADQTKGPFWDEDPNFAVLVLAARGDPARQYQYANLGTPAPVTGPVAAVRGTLLQASALRQTVIDRADPITVAATLREEAAKRAREAVLERSEMVPRPTSAPRIDA